jgi:hypothetical protein
MAAKGKKRDHKKEGTKAKSRAKKGKRSAAAVPDADAAAETTVVDFWFDPTCPWAWVTSEWMLEVEKVRPVKTVLHVMSLSVLNDDKHLSDGYRAAMDGAWPFARVSLAVEREYGQEQLRAFYRAIGTRFHPNAEPRTRETMEAALTDVGLPVEMAELGYTGDHDDDLRRSHHEGMRPVGYEVGTPVMHVGPAAWFGPVISRRPTGEAAGELWDGIRLVTHNPDFFELKRSRDVSPAFD